MACVRDLQKCRQSLKCLCATSAALTLDRFHVVARGLLDPFAVLGRATSEGSISVAFDRTRPGYKCSVHGSEKLFVFSALQETHQTSAVIRSRELRPKRTDFGLAAAKPVLSPSRITLENNGKIRPQLYLENAFARAGGGATGIRTLETVSRLHTFQACAFDHSATAPLARHSPARRSIARGNRAGFSSRDGYRCGGSSAPSFRSCPDAVRRSLRCGPHGCRRRVADRWERPHRQCG